MRFDSVGTTAFGRRGVTRAQILAQRAVKDALATCAAPQRAGRETAGDGVHKWSLLRTLGEIRDGLGVSDRTLGVLSALLSFHPETALTLAPDQGDGEPRDAGAGASHAGLVVFPSNRALSLRCNGMSEATLRRHLAALVEAGLIIRRDSPNGKRFARRAGGGGARETEVEVGLAQAFGFDLAPLVARASEFSARLERLRGERLRLRVLKERVTLLRRDLSKRIAFALDAELAGPWDGLRLRYLDLCAPLRRMRAMDELETLTCALEALLEDVVAALERGVNAGPNPDGAVSGGVDAHSIDGDGAHFGRLHTESNPEQIPDLDPASEEAGAKSAPSTRDSERARDLPLPVILDACPDIRDYDVTGRPIADWTAFVALAASVRPMLGISPDAWREAVAVLGERAAATAIAFILQRCEHSSEATRRLGPDGRASVTVNGSPAIRSPGGYLRALTQKGRSDDGDEAPFSLWGAILGHLAQRGKAGGPARRSP